VPREAILRAHPGGTATIFASGFNNPKYLAFEPVTDFPLNISTRIGPTHVGRSLQTSKTFFQCYENTSIANRTRPRQRWLILFSSGLFMRSWLNKNNDTILFRHLGVCSRRGRRRSASESEYGGRREESTRQYE